MAPLIAYTGDHFHPVMIVATVVLLVIVAALFRRDRRPLRLPPGPKGWPIVGALPLLGAKPHEALANMAKQYGPVMHLKMGTSDLVVASTAGAARAFLKPLDANFLNRPETAVGRAIREGGQDLVFGDHGPRWKALRKLSNLHIFGGKARDESARFREQEVTYMLKIMCEASRRGVPVVVPKLLVCALANNIGLIVLGRRLFELDQETSAAKTGEFKDAIVEYVRLSGLFNIGDFIPSIQWMDLQGIDAQSRKSHKKVQMMLGEMIRQHMETADERVGNPDVLDHLLMATGGEASDDESLSVANIKGLVQNMFVGGTDTSSSAIEWALAELIQNPSILRRAQEEMDRVIGRDRRLRESDVPNLPYLQAICKEVLRKHPSLPLIPRVAAEDCQVQGYDIPRGTRVMVNVWAIGRDPETWENPLEFMPQRFLGTGKGANINPWGNDFELIPFGTGRRICAGMKLGMVLIEYILGTLVHEFDWKLPDGVGEVNMDELFGLSLQKAVPLSAVVTPRLSASAYASTTNVDA